MGHDAVENGRSFFIRAAFTLWHGKDLKMRIKDTPSTWRVTVARTDGRMLPAAGARASVNDVVMTQPHMKIFWVK